MATFSFRKRDRLCSENDIQELFRKGSSFYLHPFKVLYLPTPTRTTDQVLITVSSRHFKRAVDRNLIKRRVREAYRLNRSSPHEKTLHIGLIYSAPQILPFHTIEQKLIEALQRLEAGRA